MMDPASPDIGKPVGDEPSNEARQWAMFAHLASLIGYVIPLGNIVGPLVVWLIKKDEFPFVDDQGQGVVEFPDLDADLRHRLGTGDLHLRGHHYHTGSG